ncbi:hypothetical protein EZV62_022804 [Acer yangbiense]|uniref:ABC transporter domain-containing protein n=1 Tax=Acer yangbiense TaxID=1000413 RepID=A0A5C7GZR8_9ROSI|nr:hypothetical protein EZV62_022804 [Acer yangbiense]
MSIHKARGSRSASRLLATVDFLLNLRSKFHCKSSKIKFAKKPCFDFLWTSGGGGNQMRIQKIVDGIMNNNPGRKIHPHKVKSFKTKGEVNNWFIKNPLSSPGAQHFEERNASVIGYGIQASTTQTQLDDFLESMGLALSDNHLNDVYNWLMATFVLWFMLTIYFDNVTPNAPGVRKLIFYHVIPGYWTGRGGNKAEECGCCCTDSVSALEHVTPDDEDDLWMNVDKDRLFCLLGPNGVGKTTSISCLTGITPVTAVDAFVYGDSIRSSTGLSNIRRIIGVCPQFDILWDELSGREHLHLFASIKGLLPASIKSVAENSLAEVRLNEAAKVRAGMKRCLSVAIALIGHPKLIILDEPIPLGARFVGIPGTETAENPRGIMVDVYWETDDSGDLHIAGHSPEC